MHYIHLFVLFFFFFIWNKLNKVTYVLISNGCFQTVKVCSQGLLFSSISSIFAHIYDLKIHIGLLTKSLIGSSIWHKDIVYKNAGQWPFQIMKGRNGGQIIKTWFVNNRFTKTIHFFLLTLRTMIIKGFSASIYQFSCITVNAGQVIKTVLSFKII